MIGQLYQLNIVHDIQNNTPLISKPSDTGYSQEVYRFASTSFIVTIEVRESFSNREESLHLSLHSGAFSLNLKLGYFL